MIMKKITTDKALIFSAIMIIIFTTVMIIMFYQFQTIPDSLVVAFFAAFACEGGYCAMIHKVKKDADRLKNKETLEECLEEITDTEEFEEA